MTPISPCIPERLRWHSWAHDAKDGKALTGDELLDSKQRYSFRKTLRELEPHLRHPCVTLSLRQPLLTLTTT